MIYFNLILILCATAANGHAAMMVVQVLVSDSAACFAVLHHHDKMCLLVLQLKWSWFTLLR